MSQFIVVKNPINVDMETKPYEDIIDQLKGQ